MHGGRVTFGQMAATQMACLNSSGGGLAGTSWQLVKFEGSDDTTITKAKQ